MSELIQDLRFGARVLRKNRGFTAVAIASLALAIGANTAIFSLLNGLALRDLSVPQPKQLVRFGAQIGDDPVVELSLPLFEQITNDQRVFSSTFAWWGDNLYTVEINGALSRNDIWAVTGNFYSELGATPLLGRLIGPEDDDLKSASPTPVVVLAHSFWQRVPQVRFVNLGLGRLPSFADLLFLAYLPLHTLLACFLSLRQNLLEPTPKSF